MKQRCGSITSHLINLLTSSLLLSFCWITKTFSYLHNDAPLLWNSWCPFPSSSLSTCAFSSFSLWNWLHPSPLCWCCSDRKTHPPLATLALSPSLTLIGCLVKVTSLFFPACPLPLPLLPPSLSLSLSLRGFWPFLYCATLFLSSSSSSYGSEFAHIAALVFIHAVTRMTMHTAVASPAPLSYATNPGANRPQRWNNAHTKGIGLVIPMPIHYAAKSLHGFSSLKHDWDERYIILETVSGISGRRSRDCVDQL